MSPSQLRFSIFTAVICISLLTSCSSTPVNLKAIPDTSTAVVSYDLKSIFSKGKLSQLSELKSIQFLQEELKNEDEGIQKIFNKIIEDPWSTGIDFSESLYTYSMEDGQGAFFSCMSIELGSEGKFTAFLNEMNTNLGGGAALEIKERDNFKYTSPDPNIIIGWDKNLIVLMIPLGYRSRDKLEYGIKKSFNLPSDENISNVKAFNNFTKNAGDINFFLSSELLLNTYGYRSLTEELRKSLEGNFLLAHINFEEDQISANCYSVLSDYTKNESLVAEISGTIDDDLLEYLPYEYYLTGGMHLDFEEYLEKIEGRDEYKEINREIEKETGLSMIEIAKAFEGDFAFNLFDFRTGRYNEPLPIFAVVTNIDDESVIEELASKYGSGIPLKDGYYTFDENYLGMSNGYMMFTNDENTIKRFEIGELDKNLGDADISDKISDYPIFFGMKLNSLDYPSSVRSEIDSEMGRNGELVDLWNATMKEIEFKVINTTNFKMDLILTESGENSLYRIIKLIDENYQKMI